MTLPYEPIDPAKNYRLGTWLLRVHINAAPSHHLVVRQDPDDIDPLTSIVAPNAPARIRAATQIAPITYYTALPAIDVTTHPIPAGTSMRFVGRMPDDTPYLLYVHDLLGEREYGYIERGMNIHLPSHHVNDLPHFHGYAVES